MACFTLEMLTSGLLNAQNKAFQIVGYYPIEKVVTADVAKIPFDKLTQVDLAFINPDVNGDFTEDFSTLKPFIDAAHQKKAKVLMSMGGGANPQQFHQLMEASSLKKFVASIIKVVEQNNLDGVDVDLESSYAFGPTLDPNYNSFVKLLAKELKRNSKLLTAALPGRGLGDNVSQETLQEFDYINVMSYDHTGPWDPSRKGNHASYADFVDDLNYYLNTLKIPKDKIIMGVPFYGHAFGPNLTDKVIPWISYKDIVSEYPGSEMVNHWHLSNGYIVYYNGVPMMRDKTDLAMKKAAGIMIWNLALDSDLSDKSLLNAIYLTAHNSLKF